MTQPDQAMHTEVNDALNNVRKLLALRITLERALADCVMNLNEAWKNVPHMPVRSYEEIELEARLTETREARMLKAARGNKKVAKILEEIMYG